MTTETVRPSPSASDVGARGLVLDRAHACICIGSTLVRAEGRAVVAPARARTEDMGISRRPMRICLVYDCLFPHTVGGAERWYRRLGRASGRRRPRRLPTSHCASGNAGDDPGVAGVDVRAVGPRMRPLRRTRAAPDPAAARVRGRSPVAPGSPRPALRRGAHRARSRTSRCWRSPLLAPLHGYRVVVDWFEVWSRSYWRELPGTLGRRRRAGWSSGCARGFRSGRSASLACTRAGCARRGCAARSRCWRAHTTDRWSPSPARTASRWWCSPGATSRRSGSRRSCRRSRDAA